MASSSRQDSRSPSDLRPISIKLNRLSRADGSARFAFGSRAALASFSGPIEVRLRDEQPDKATLEVVHRPIQGVGDTSSRALEATLRAVLTPILQLSAHPRALVQIVVQSLSTPSASYGRSSESSSSYETPTHTWPQPPNHSFSAAEEPEAGPSRSSTMSGLSMGDKSATINSVSIAALDAGAVGMRGVPVAIALALIPRRAGSYYADTDGTSEEEGVMVLDPTEEEERQAYARFGFGWVRGAGLASAHDKNGGNAPDGDNEMDGDEDGEMEIIWSEAQGRFSRDQYNDALALSRQAVQEVLGQIRESLAAKFSNR